MKLINFFKGNYLAFLVFGFVFAILMVDLNPDFTFINKAADSIGYIYSAQYLYPSYHTSPPLYLLTSHLFLMLPFGTEAWRMGLFSVLSTMGACIFIYLIIRRKLSDNNNSQLFALLGVLLYGLSALVLSQSIIVNTYATTTMLAAGAYYFAIKQQWKRMALIVGIGLAIHLLMVFVLAVLFLGYREYRHNWKALLITFSFCVFYAYIPLTNREPFMWFPAPDSVNIFRAIFDDVLGTINMLIGSLGIWDLPKRLLDVLGIIGVSIGGITIIPLVYYFRRTKFWKSVLFWLIVVPIVLFIGELDMNTFDYMMVAMPFLTVAICCGLAMMKGKFGKILQVATLVVVLGFGLFNAWFFDIGNNLDKNLGATNLFRNEFNKIPDGAIFMPNYAWEWEAIYKYNADNDKHIYPICIDILPSKNYQQQLIGDGIKLVPSDTDNVSIKASEIAKSIVRLNDNVWTTKITDPYTFSSEVVPTNNNEDTVANVDKQKIEQITNNPPIQWKPYSPYRILTTELFITEWNYILYTNWNLRFFVGWGSIGLILVWLFNWVSNKKDKVMKDE